MSIHFLFIGLFTLFAIFVLFKSNKPQKMKSAKEAFTTSMDNSIVINPETLEKHLKSDFEKNTKKNPFANVLLTDIGDNPTRKAAPPAFNPQVYEDITKSTKKMVQNINPGIKNTNEQLFGDLGENFYLDQSMRIFNSTANTKIPNDQGAFADYLYGNMPSCRDGDAFACVQDNQRYLLI